MNDVEKKVGGRYLYSWAIDKGVTGRFEITLFNSKTEMDARQGGELVWSKKSTGVLPFEEKGYPELLNKIDAKTRSK